MNTRISHKNNGNLNPYPLKLYGSADGREQALALKVAKLLKTKLAPSLYKVFSNGEFIVHHCDTVRDRDVYIICQPRFGNKENLSFDLDECESLILALRQGEPSRVTVVMPCLPYARQDKSSNHREPVLSQKVPMRLQMAGAHRLVVLKLHNPSSYNAHPLSIPMVDVDTDALLLEHIRSKKFDLSKFKIVAPDLGAAPSCRKLAQQLGIPGNIVIINKFRDPKKANHNEVMEIIGDPKGYNFIMPDDMADTCGTAIKVLDTLKQNGAKDVYFTATHAILSGDAIEKLNKSDFKGIWFTDTCLTEEAQKKIKKLEVISTTKLIARVIDNLHNGISVTELWHNSK
ncbi:ribose-phosphate diphosphokinase [Patescibacteria group bacterium]|nr:ribose-phosphate diphosphokinase [Patescibacteria group bacterium]